MTSNLENSTVAISKFFRAEPSSAEGGGWVSPDPEGKTQIKILAMDEANQSYEMLLWLASDTTFGTGRHTHGGESYVFILEGGYSLTAYADHSDKVGTTIRYRKGDFVYQPHGQIHEEFLAGEDTLLYVSNRGSSTTYEAFDEDGNIVMTETLAELRQNLKTS